MFKKISQRTLFLQTVQDLGLSTEGSPATLRTRHERWCNIWNAEIDSIKPRTIGHLLQVMADWDRERSRIKETPKIEDANSYVVSESRACGPCFLKFYQETHKDQFKELTESARPVRIKKAEEIVTGLSSQTVSM